MSKIRINKRKEYKEQLRLFINLSNNVRRKIRRHFTEYSDLAENLYNDIGQVPKEYYDDYYSDMLTILSNNAREVIITMGNRLERTRIVKKSDDIDSVISTYTTTATAQNVTNITETTRKSIQAEIKLGLETGLSNPQISKNIKKSTGFSAKRATLIARTETHQAMNYGNQSIAKRLGLKKPVKEWASAMDERARSWHVNMNGVQVGIDEPFKILTPVSGGAIVEKQLQYAGDPNGGATNTINCRCFVLYYDADDITDDAPRRPPITEEIPEPPIKEINATSLANPIRGSAIVVTKSKEDLIADVRKKSTDGFTDKTELRKYLVNRYRGGINEGKSYIDKWNERELTEFSILLDEANEIATKHKLPKLRGTASTGRMRATMAMGDGILYVNPRTLKGKGSKYEYMERMDNRRMDKLSSYQIGNTKLEERTLRRQDIKYDDEIPFSSAFYLAKGKNISKLSKDEVADLSFATKRNTLYHEMGHHVHQQTKAITGKGNIEDSLNAVFNKAVRKDNKLMKEQGISNLYPSGYSATNSAEWFAENFACYYNGNRNKCSKDWIEFYEKEILARL